MRERADVVIIGGGLAGLAALASLRARGIDALLVERDRELGDHRPMVDEDGVLLPRGPMVWDAANTSVTRLFEMLGLGPDVMPVPMEASVQWLVRGDRLRPREPALRQLLGRTWRRFRRGGPRALVLKDGVGRLGAQASQKLPVTCGITVERIDESGTGVVVRGRHNDDSVIIQAKAIVVATGGATAASLLPARPILESTISELSQSPLAVLHWQEPEPGASRFPRGIGWHAPAREGCFALGTVFVSDVLGEDGARRFATFVGGVRTPERARLSNGELARVVGEEVRRLGGQMGRVLRVDRTVERVATDQAGRIAELQASFEDSRITLAGGWLGHGTVSDAVEAGFAAAEDVVARLSRPAVAAPARAESMERAESPVAATSMSTFAAPAPAQGGVRAPAPLFVVGASYREGTTDVRARLAALEAGPDSPSKALVRAGYADGVVVLETCSRVEWIVSSSRPQWAAELLKSTLALRVPEVRLHSKVGHAGAHYLLRLAMGLDSVAEGEPAVGRQLVLAFEKGHKEGNADRALRLSWRAVQQLLGERRRRGVVQHGLGVQTLALEELAARGVKTSDTVLVFGQGEIGRAVSSALRDAGYTKAEAYRRATHDAFHEAAKAARAVVVCTGGPSAFLELPARMSGATVVDVGVPEQVKAAPGWEKVTLEELLQRPRRLLDDETRAWLVEQVGLFADRLSKDLAAPPPATALSVIDEERRVFLRETLPPLLEKLPQQSAEDVRKAVATFAHHLMERVREGGVS